MVKKRKRLKLTESSFLYFSPSPAKLEETKPVEAVTGNDITAPPNKELPPSPEKKTKVGVVSHSTSLFPWLLFLLAFLLLKLWQHKFCFLSCLLRTIFLEQRHPVMKSALQTTQPVVNVTESGFSKCVVSFV